MKNSELKVILIILGICSILVAVVFVLVNKTTKSPIRQPTYRKPLPYTREKALENWEHCFKSGAKFLIEKQIKEGDNIGAWANFRGTPSVAYTALIVRALAKTPQNLRKEYEQNITLGVEFILKCQNEDGSFNEPGELTLTTYKTAIAISALAAVDKIKYKEQIIKARDFFVANQYYEDSVFQKVDKDNEFYGGWGYDYKKDKPRADLSTTEFALESLKDADLPKDDPTWQRAIVFLQRVQSNSEKNDFIQKVKEKYKIEDDGGFFYHPIESKAQYEDRDGKTVLKSYGSMTYAGLKSMIYAGLTKDDERVQLAYKWIKENYTLDKNPGMPKDNEKMGLYYYYHTFAKALDVYGEKTVNINKQVEKYWAYDLLLKFVYEQNKADNSWQNQASERWEEGDPILVTAYVLNSLNYLYKWLSD